MKVKRLLMALLAMVFSVSSALAEIKSGSCGDNATWTLDTETGLLKIDGTGAMNKYSYYSSSPFNSNRNYINKVEIADGITSIGDYAFYSCSNLSSVAIPNSVIGIGEQAFNYCNGLTAVHIYDLAAWCKISFLDTNNNPLKYAHNLYLNGKLVTDLTIPNTVTSIAPYAFYGCSCLTSVTIPNSVTSFGNMAFWDCM